MRLNKHPFNRENMEKNWLIKGTKKYNAVVERLKANTATTQQVLQYFQLSNETLTELRNIEAKAAIADFYKHTTASRSFKTNTYRVAGL